MESDILRIIIQSNLGGIAIILVFLLYYPQRDTVFSQQQSTKIALYQ